MLNTLITQYLSKYLRIATYKPFMSYDLNKAKEKKILIKMAVVFETLIKLYYNKTCA